MRTLLDISLMAVLLGATACVGGAQGQDSLALEDESDGPEDGQDGAEDAGQGGEDEDQHEAGDGCRTALDCEHALGERCLMETADVGVCGVPSNVDDPIWQMGPAGQPPPPFVDRRGGV